MDRAQQPTRTAGEAGWHASRYNVSAKLLGDEHGRMAVANLYKGNCSILTPMELYLLSVVEELSETHPIIERLAKRGIIANFDERAVLESIGRGACGMSRGVGLTICPTMGCNFDCPYCFEDHTPGLMTPEVQDDVVDLAERMLETSGAKNLSVTWFGGEPLLGAKVIESISERLIALAEKHGADYKASIITNGYLLTAENVALLGRARVTTAQVTLDGIGSAHDATRHLVGGGSTFDRIVENLGRPGLPFKVNVRHNVHEGNKDQIEGLRSFVEDLAEKSGNDLEYYSAPVTGSDTADERGHQVGLLDEFGLDDVEAQREAGRFRAGRGSYCGAHSIWSLGIDEKGHLHKCWEAVDKPHLSFGDARDWDPSDPFASAARPDLLTCFLNTAIPVPDDECRECVWLPHCVGGCPYKRLFGGGKQCVAYRDDPTPYVLALAERIGKDKGEKKEG